MTMPLSGTVCHQQTVACYDKPTTKVEMPIFTRYGNMKGIAKCRKWGDFGSCKVIENSTTR